MLSRGAIERIESLMQRGEWAQAEMALKRAMASEPSEAALPVRMTSVLLAQGRPEQAEFYARRSVALAPRLWQVHMNLGNVLAALSKFEEAIACFRTAAELAPGEPECVVSMSNALSGMNRYSAAAGLLKDAMARFPGYVPVLNNYAHALHAMGRVEEAAPLLRRVTGLEPGNLRWAQGLAAMLNYAPGVSARELLDAHRRFGELARATLGPGRVWDRRRARPLEGRALRVGLISPDLRRHAVSFLIEAFLEHADPSLVQIACYSAVGKGDEVTARLRSRASLWRDIAGVRDPAAADLVAADGIDVLVDLAGHTQGHRLGVLALKAAPVQATYMGYPNCTGLAAVDYRIVDTLSEPAGCEAFSVEKLLRMDPCFLSYRPPDDPPPVAPAPLSQPGSAGPVFGAFSTLLKLNTPLIALWARVLKAVPGSTIILKHFGLREEGVREDVRARFVDAGVEPGRVLAEPPEPTALDTMRAYSRVDIALDTFPYNGTTTICEASLMGVPVVSLRGQTPASRVSTSLLAAIGTPELCAASEAEFVEIGAALARDPARLVGLRAELRDRLRRSAIGDGPAFARRMTDALRGAWETWHSGG
jgi:protein O-GlcNAc transferase